MSGARGFRNWLAFTLVVATLSIVVPGFVDDLVATLLLLPLACIALTFASVWSGVLLLRFWEARAWSRVVVLAILPAMAVATAAHPAFVGLMLDAADTLHFVERLPEYDRVIDALPHNGLRYHEFNWGGMTFLSHGVVYDETDEVALPYGRQSAAWKRRLHDTDLTCGGDGPISTERHLWSHYYLTSFGC